MRNAPLSQEFGKSKCRFLFFLIHTKDWISTQIAHIPNEISYHTVVILRRISIPLLCFIYIAKYSLGERDKVLSGEKLCLILYSFYHKILMLFTLQLSERGKPFLVCSSRSTKWWSPLTFGGLSVAWFLIQWSYRWLIFQPEF